MAIRAHKHVQCVSYAVNGGVLHLEHTADGVALGDIYAVFDLEHIRQVHAHKVHEACRAAVDLNAVDHCDKSAAFVTAEVFNTQETALALLHELCKSGGERTAGGGDHTACQRHALFRLHSGENSCLRDCDAALGEQIKVSDYHVAALADVVNSGPTGDSRAAFNKRFGGNKVCQRVGEQYRKRRCAHENARQDMRKLGKGFAHGCGNQAQKKRNNYQIRRHNAVNGLVGTCFLRAADKALGGHAGLEYRNAVAGD